VNAAPPDVTALLRAWTGGDRGALDRLVPLVYGELRGLARRAAGRERSALSLQPTAIVHEAYLRLVDIRQIQWRDRAHFFAMSAELMRRILVDRARTRATLKRGERLTPAPLDEDVVVAVDRPRELIALDDALTSLAKVDARKARVVELRFFAGLNAEETAAVLDVSVQTVHRDWKLSKAWLTRAMRGGERSDG